MDKLILPNPPIEILGEKSFAFQRMLKRINQLDGMLTFVHAGHENFDGSHLDYTLELAADVAFEIRELAAMIDDATPPADEVEAMRKSYRQTVEGAERLLSAMSKNPQPLTELEEAATLEMEGHIGAARDDFLGHVEVQS